MNHKFQLLVQSFIAEGYAENDALVAANQVDRAYYNSSTNEEIAEMAKKIVSEDFEREDGNANT
jgi:uncharacterized protein YdaT